jgi:hypothetical protein
MASIGSGGFERGSYETSPLCDNRTLTFTLWKVTEHEKEPCGSSDYDPSRVQGKVNINSFPWAVLTSATNSFVWLKALTSQTYICRGGSPVSRAHDFAVVSEKATLSQQKQASSQHYFFFVRFVHACQALCSFQ